MKIYKVTVGLSHCVLDLDSTEHYGRKTPSNTLPSEREISKGLQQAEQGKLSMLRTRETSAFPEQAGHNGPRLTL